MSTDHLFGVFAIVTERDFSHEALLFLSVTETSAIEACKEIHPQLGDGDYCHIYKETTLVVRKISPMATLKDWNKYYPDSMINNTGDILFKKEVSSPSLLKLLSLRDYKN